MKKGTMIAAAALTMMIAQPCLAAEDLRGLGTTEQRTGLWMGGTVRVALGEPKAKRPEARLQLGLARNYRSTSLAVPERNMRVASFEIGSGKGDAPALYMAGTDVRDFKQKLGMNTGTAVAIGGGVLLVALAVVFASSKKVPDDTFDCWDGC